MILVIVREVLRLLGFIACGVVLYAVALVISLQ